MFTGIVQGLCPVTAVQPGHGASRLRIDLGDLAAGAALGASIAVNGTCLTVAEVTGSEIEFDVIAETLRLTNLDELAPGALVNVERSARVGDEIGGHTVSGHITGVATVLAVERDGADVSMLFQIPDSSRNLLFQKGFVALDGASLTIASLDVEAGTLRVALIPETLERTRFGSLAAGDRVNLEVDPASQAIVETVQRLFQDPAWRQRLLPS